VYAVKRWIRRIRLYDKHNMKELSVLRVTNSIYPEVMGGVGLHTHYMSRVQAEMGHDVTVLTSDNGDQRLPRNEARDGYKIRRLHELIRPVDNSITPQIFKYFLMMNDEFDIIHLHSHLYFSSNVCAILSPLTDTPIVLTNHGLISQTAPNWLQRIFNPTIGKITFEAADRILCYTQTDKKRLRDRGIKADISVIHNGIDCTMFAPDGRRPNKQLLFVGRLKTGKGVDTLVKSFGRIAFDHPDWTLKIVGDGPLRNDLEADVERLGIESQVDFLGKVPNKNMPELYNESAIFVLPSLNEGMPRTVLEAMACGTPVVTSDLPQLIPVVGKNAVGYTFKTGSVTELSARLEQIISGKDRRKEMAINSRDLIVNNYSWSETVKETVKVYREVL